MKFERIHFDTVASTNQTAIDYPVYTAITAASQTGGRGRYGKSWVSPVGNLYMSVVMPDTPQTTPFLAFAVAVSVAEALKDFHVRLKWPNDVLLDGKKLAGILLEKHDDKIIVGIGVNIVSHPTQGLSYEATDLNGALRVDDLSNTILTLLSKHFQNLQSGGFLPLRDQWKSYAAGLGTSVAVNLPNARMTGIFKDLGDTGALLLQQPDGTITEVTAGAVFLLDQH